MKMYEDYAYKIKYWINYIAQNYDPILKWYGGQYMDTKLTSVKNDQTTHRTFKGRIIASCQVLTYYKEPWFEGWVLAEPGLVNYRGFVENEGEIVPEWVLYK